jgi:peptidylprolyl isomerase
MTQEVRQGDEVKIHLTGTLTDGTIFLSSYESDPLEFKVGEGQLFLGIEQALVGMNPGDKKTVNLSANEAFGPYRTENIVVIEKKHLPEHIDPQVGMMLEKVEQDGRKVSLAVTDVTESTVTLDANHPLAGKDLNFLVDLVEIK